VYAATERVIEMEYVDDAVNIARASQHFAPRDTQAYRRELARIRAVVDADAERRRLNMAVLD